MTDSSSVTTIYLLRHGDYENPLNIFHGRLPGFPLSTEGLRQVKQLGQYTAHLPITAVYASPLTRTFQTAQAIADVHHLTVQTDDRLMDLVTPLQGKPIAYMESINWSFYRHEFIKQGGESLSTVFRRMDTCIREKVAKHPGQHIVVVSHGDCVMAVKIKYLGLPLRSRKLMYPYVPVASGYIIRMDGKEIVLSVADFPS
ncbi:MAG: histidine phosphatase family protein [Candidatus Gottesmanbacteria bacterium]|nr:histidine phosphatase family protein [Candidatus Gottesmanbacteria bacterium]